MSQIGREVGKNQRQIQDLKKGAPGGICPRFSRLKLTHVRGHVCQNYYFFLTVLNFFKVKYFFLPNQIFVKV